PRRTLEAARAIAVRHLTGRGRAEAGRRCLRPRPPPEPHARLPRARRIARAAVLELGMPNRRSSPAGARHRSPRSPRRERAARRPAARSAVADPLRARATRLRALAPKLAKASDGERRHGDRTRTTTAAVRARRPLVTRSRLEARSRTGR